MTEFDFGITQESQRYFAQKPSLLPFLERLMTVGNNVFARTYTPAGRVQDVGFDLGQRCREDYLDVTFLFVHGRKEAALKLLRGLYERCLALAYMMAVPEKAERFVRYAAIQEHRMMQAALRVVPEEQFDQALAPKTSAAQIRKFYEEIKPEFQVTVCKNCGTKRVQGTWDVDVATMATKVGQPFTTLFLLAYTIPTGHIHATLASTSLEQENDRSKEHDDFVLIVATEIYLEVLRLQDRLFSLNLHADIETCTQRFRMVWPELTDG